MTVPTKLLSILVGSFLFLLLSASHAHSAERDPVTLLRAIDDLWRASSSQGRVRMEVRTAHYSRILLMETWSQGRDRSLVRIVLPLKEKDSASLKNGNTMYSYLPKTDRTIRLTSGMMMGSWMGSHFTNDDLVKESRLSEDYAAQVTFSGERGGRQIIEFTLTPHPDAVVVWGRVVLSLNAVDGLPLLATYYDEDGILVRSIIFSEVRELGGRRLPTRLRVLPADKPGEYTDLVYEALRFDLDLADSFFSLAQLRRR